MEKTKCLEYCFRVSVSARESPEKTKSLRKCLRGSGKNKELQETAQTLRKKQRVCVFSGESKTMF
jgi:hypothetical protein